MPKQRWGTLKSGAIVCPVNMDRLTPWSRALVAASGRKWISRNSACPCGSGKRFKRCCLETAVRLKGEKA